MYFSKSTGGFYDPSRFGAPTIQVPDPANPGKFLTQPNPACLMPADVVLITDAQYQAAIDGQSAGLAIVVNTAGFPMPAPSPTPAQLLAQAQAKQAAIVGAACAAQITGSFVSSALGAAYTYASGVNDQLNISGQVTSSLLPGLLPTWTTQQSCTSAAGVWAYRPHTAAQIQKVGTDVQAWVLTARMKNATLQSMIAAATSIAAVNAVVW
jgi:hypothetical protein